MGFRSWSRSRWPRRACRVSFAEAVRARLADLSEAERLVVHTAALFGRQFDWRLLPRATGLAADEVAGALERGVRSQLLAVDGGLFRFRHMLTREAVVAELLPPRRVALAARALAALEAAHPELPGAAGDLAADLAIQADDPARAGLLLTESGRSALGRGALATATSTLRRAARLLTAPDQRAEAETLLVEALALAGQVDEAMRIGDRLIAGLTPGGDAGRRRAAIHLKLAHAAVDGTRWAAARRHVGIAGDLLAADPEPGLSAETAVLDAEIALAADDAGDRARALAESVLASPGASVEIRCRALELLGRVRRARDLDGARDAFEQALATADAAGLAVWRLRALHELGTIDMFDHAGTDRLSQARRIASELGAASTGAVIDLQLTATAMFRFELDEADRHAESALAASNRLGLGTTGAIARVFRAEVCALRRDRAEMERFIALALAAAPGDRGDRRQRARRRPGDADAARRRYGRRAGRLRPGHRRPRRRAPARPGSLPRPVAAAARRAWRPAGDGRDRSRPGHWPDRQPGQPRAARVRRGDPGREGRRRIPRHRAGGGRRR